MAPLENLHSRDLAWISDFVVQQVALMLRPFLEHLEQTDVAVDHAQRLLHSLGMEVEEVKGDVERTSRHLATLRRGLGVQGEGHCVLQRGLEGAVSSAQRLEEQQQRALELLRGLEEGLGQQQAEQRALGARQEDLVERAAASAAAMEDLRALAERAADEARAARDGVADSQARLDGCQRELRELRRAPLGLAPKLEEKASRLPAQAGGRGPPAADPAWPPSKRVFAAAEVPAVVTAEPAAFSAQQKRVSRSGSGLGRSALALPTETADTAQPPWSSSRATAGAELGELEEGLPPLAGDDALSGSRLPTLAARQHGASRPPDRASADGPRLRFIATLATPPSRGSPS